MIIDLHGHQICPGMLDRHEFWGPKWKDGTIFVGDWELGTKKRDFARDASAILDWMAPDARLQKMDAQGIDVLVVSVPSHMYMYWAGDYGTEFARITNDEFASFASANPDRLKFWAHVPMADPSAAVTELERAVTELGAVGMGIGGANFGGLEVFDEAYDPLWAKVCELGVPVFVHGYNQSVTWGKQANDDPYDTTSIVGMCYDETRCFWYLVNGGVLDRFPELQVYITHGGGFAPYQLRRMEETNLTMAPDSKNQRKVSEYRENFYFDPLVHSAAMRQAIVTDVGVDRLLYGDNFGGADSIDFDLTEGLGLSDEDRERIRSGNAKQLLGL